jgi:hypothetical protein
MPHLIGIQTPSKNPVSPMGSSEIGHKKKKKQDSSSKIKVCFPCDGGLFSRETCEVFGNQQCFAILLNLMRLRKDLLYVSLRFLFLVNASIICINEKPKGSRLRPSKKDEGEAK